MLVIELSDVSRTPEAQVAGRAVRGVLRARGAAVSVTVAVVTQVRAALLHLVTARAWASLQ